MDYTYENITLRDELENRYIHFIDGFGNTQYIFDFIKKTICGELTNWKEINIKENNKYKKLLNINGDYYNGDYNDYAYDGMMALIYKISIKKYIKYVKYIK